MRGGQYDHPDHRPAEGYKATTGRTEADYQDRHRDRALAQGYRPGQEARGSRQARTVRMDRAVSERNEIMEPDDATTHYGALIRLQVTMSALQDMVRAANNLSLDLERVASPADQEAFTKACNNAQAAIE